MDPMMLALINQARQEQRHYGYNISRGLRAYKEALRQAVNTNGRVRIHCIGDSVTRGEYASDEANKSWVGLIRQKLQSRYGAIGEGFINTYEASLPSGAQPRWSAPEPHWKRVIGIGAGMYHIEGVSGGFDEAATVLGSGDTVILVGAKGPTGGKADVYIDDVLAGEIDCYSPDVTWGYQTVFSGLTDDTHTVKIVRQGNGTVFLDGAIFLKEGSGVEVNRLAVSGTRITNVVFDATGNWDNMKKALTGDGTWVPHLAILAFGLNDVRSISLSTYKARMQQLIEFFQGLGASVLLLAYFKPADAWTTAWPEVVHTLYSLADTCDCALVDIYAAWGSYEVAQGNGLFGKSANDYSGGSGTNLAHPSDKGYKSIADILEPHLIL